MAAHMTVQPDRFLSVWQVHSADVITVNGPWTGERPKADALVTSTPDLAISIATADCGPILFADARNRVIGAAHAGWQGAFKGILEATLSAMEALGARRASTHVVIGPMLSQQNYEVGPEFVARFLEQSAENAAFFRSSPREGHAQFDLPAYIRMRLNKSGALHLCRREALLLVSALHTSQGTRLRPPDFGDQARGLIRSCRFPARS
jgi:polyphenol oxidase